jgi:hypothetical protein
MLQRSERFWSNWAGDLAAVEHEHLGRGRHHRHAPQLLSSQGAFLRVSKNRQFRELHVLQANSFQLFPVLFGISGVGVSTISILRDPWAAGKFQGYWLPGKRHNYRTFERVGGIHV